MNNGYLELMWQQEEEWRLLAAAISGVIVGLIYFYSLRWSIERIGELSHKLKFFVVTAMLRIALFFGVLVLISHRNVAVILIYVLMFFITKAGIIWVEKKRYTTDTAKEEKTNEL